MRVSNVHERTVRTEKAVAREVFESLATKRDRLWPRKLWPPIRLNAPKEKMGAGGHGPIRYRVAGHEVGRKTTFTFEQSGLSRGMVGAHFFELLETAGGEFTARHEIAVDLRWPAILLWPLLIRPLHDALVEDAFDNFERATTNQVSSPNRHSAYVRFLRRLVV